MPDLYATRSDVYVHGKLPRTLLANPARRCAAALAAGDTFELDGHGFETDQAVIFPRAEGGGTLPAPIVAGVTYFAIRVTESIFKAATVAGGVAIDLTTNGTNVLVATPLPFDETIEVYSRYVDDFLPAHLVPLTPPYPLHVTKVVAVLTAKDLLLGSGQQSGTMLEAKAEAKDEMMRWAKGIKLRDKRATASSNLAISGGSITVPPRGGTIP